MTLRQLRAKRGVSQSCLSGLSKTSRSMISSAERGLFVLSPQQAARIADALAIEASMGDELRQAMEPGRSGLEAGEVVKNLALIGIGFNDNGTFVLVADSQNPSLIRQVANDILRRHEQRMRDSEGTARECFHRAELGRLRDVFAGLGLCETLRACPDF